MELDGKLLASGKAKGGESMKRILSILMVALLMVSMMLVMAAPAFAAPDFGPGNSSKGPNDGGAKCHPPGQTVTEPGCK